MREKVRWDFVGGDTKIVPGYFGFGEEVKRSLFDLNDYERGVLVGAMREDNERKARVLYRFKLWRWTIEISRSVRYER